MEELKFNPLKMFYRINYLQKNVDQFHQTTIYLHAYMSIVQNVHEKHHLYDL